MSITVPPCKPPGTYGPTDYKAPHLQVCQLPFKVPGQARCYSVLRNLMTGVSDLAAGIKGRAAQEDVASVRSQEDTCSSAFSSVSRPSRRLSMRLRAVLWRVVKSVIGLARTAATSCAGAIVAYSSLTLLTSEASYADHHSQRRCPEACNALATGQRCVLPKHTVSRFS